MFISWWRMRPSCPNCGLVLEREEGGFLGSITINYAVTGVVGVVYMVIVFAFARGAPLWVLTVGGLATVSIIPALFYPRSKTIWAALDLVAFRREHDTDVP